MCENSLAFFMERRHRLFQEFGSLEWIEIYVKAEAKAVLIDES